jgi:hypothetical protein
MLKHMQSCALALFASPVQQPTFADRYQHEQQQNSRVGLSRNKTEPAMRDDLLRYAWLNRKGPFLTWRGNLTLRKLHVNPLCSSTCAQSGCLTIGRALPFAFASSCRSPKLCCIARLHRFFILVGALFLQFNTKLSSSFSPTSDKQP